MVSLSLLEEIDCLDCSWLIGEFHLADLCSVNHRTSERRSHCVEVLLNDNSSNLLASYIYFYNVIRKYIAVDVAQTDRSLDDFVSDHALEAFTL